MRSTYLAGIAFSGILHGQSLRITTAPPLPPATLGVPYVVNFQATGSTLPLYWSWGNDVPGLSLNVSTGILSGTPTLAGIYLFPIDVDAERPPGNIIDIAFRQYTIVVSGSQTGSVLFVSPSTLTIQGLGTSTTQAIRILNVGDTGTTVNWTAALITGSDWLSMGSTTGTATPATSGTLVLKTAPEAATETQPGTANSSVAVTLNATAPVSPRLPPSLPAE